MRDWRGISSNAVPDVTEEDFSSRLRSVHNDIDLFLRDLSRGIQRITVGQVPDGSGGSLGTAVGLDGAFLLAGRSVDQIAHGSTNSGGNLTLVSANSVTKGKIYLGESQTQAAFDETTGRLGIGTVSPTALLTLSQGSVEVFNRATSETPPGGGWRDEAGGSTNIYTHMNEVSPDTSNYITQQASGGGTTYTFSFGAPAVTSGTPTVTIRMYVKRINAVATAGFFADLVRGSTTIIGTGSQFFGADTFTVGAFELHTRTLTASEVAAMMAASGSLTMDLSPGGNTATDIYAVAWIEIGFTTGGTTAGDLTRWYSNAGSALTSIVDRDSHFGIGSTSTTGSMLTVQSDQTGLTGATFQPIASQTANVVRALNSTGATYFWAIAAAGHTHFKDPGVIAGVAVNTTSGRITINRDVTSAAASLDITGENSTAAAINLVENASAAAGPAIQALNSSSGTYFTLNGRQTYAPNSLGMLHVVNPTSGGDVARVLMTLRAKAAQTANLTEWQTSVPAVLSGVTKDGNYFLTSGGATGSIFTSDSAGVGSWTATTALTLTVKDSLFTIVDDVDTTKKFQFQASGITTATTRTLTVPNGDVTLAGLQIAQTFTKANIFANGTASDIPVKIIPQAAQSVNIFDIRDSTDTTSMVSVDSTFRTLMQTVGNTTYTLKVVGSGTTSDALIVQTGTGLSDTFLWLSAGGASQGKIHGATGNICVGSVNTTSHRLNAVSTSTTVGALRGVLSHTGASGSAGNLNYVDLSATFGNTTSGVSDVRGVLVGLTCNQALGAVYACEISMQMSGKSTSPGTASGRGIIFTASTTGSVDVLDLAGIDANADHTSTGAIGTLQGLTALAASEAGAGAFTTMVGADVNARADANGTDMYGTRITSSVTGVVTNLYGLYIGAQSGASTNWAIYSAGGQSSHAGNFRIGSNSAPTAKVHIDAGSTSANTAPAKYESGSLMTSAEAGAREYDGSFHYLTNSVPTRGAICTDANVVVDGDGNVVTSGGEILLAA